MNFKQIKSLSAAELNKLCRLHGIPTKHGKKARINLLCQKLSVSTTSAENIQPTCPLMPRPDNANLTSLQLGAFQALSPGYLASLEGWTTSLQQVPDIDDATVKEYLTKMQIIKGQEKRYYKLTRPFQLKPFVHSMRFHPSPLPDSSVFVCVKAECLPSQSAQEEDVKVMFVILDATSGQPLGGYCTCTVG